MKVAMAAILVGAFVATVEGSTNCGGGGGGGWVVVLVVVATSLRGESTLSTCCGFKARFAIDKLAKQA